MPAFSVFAPRRSSNIGLLPIHWHNLETSADHEQIEFPTGAAASPTLDDYAGFEQRSGRNESAMRRYDRVAEALPFGFVKENDRQG